MNINFAEVKKLEIKPLKSGSIKVRALASIEEFL